MQLLLKNPLLSYSEGCFYNYYMHENSLTHQEPYIMFTGHYAFEDNLKSIIDDNKERPCIKYLYNYLLNLYLIFWNKLYFSKHKKEYIEHLKSFAEYGRKHNFDTKRLEKHIFLADYHLSFLYWKIIRPIGKYLIVLPFIRLKNFLEKKYE